jgi:cysteinyl-tRNA synthetase
MKVIQSWKTYAEKILPAELVESYTMQDDFLKLIDNATPEAKKDEKFSMHINALKTARTAILEKDSTTYFTKVKDVYLPILDKEQGAKFTDLSIFKTFTAHWELDYNNDMAHLNVLKPTKVIRVSDVVPEIVSFVEKIIESGSAYATTSGDVYFDVRSFQTSGHQYAKLKPTNANTEQLLAEGEGSLTIGAGKKSPADFALWKSSKPGEPFWPSPWSHGRPGWHIECSVMASMAFGDNMDIHSGGIDLAFPHHDNELAQSEAYHDCQQWVNYFLHTGHLSIEGQKMSKSLKNFITIREALGKYTARQLRLAFATTAWDGPMDFKDDVMEEMKSLEEKICVWFSKAELLYEIFESGQIQSATSQDDAMVSKLAERYFLTPANLDYGSPRKLSMPHWRIISTHVLR